MCLRLFDGTRTYAVRRTRGDLDTMWTLLANIQSHFFKAEALIIIS